MAAEGQNPLSSQSGGELPIGSTTPSSRESLMRMERGSVRRMATRRREVRRPTRGPVLQSGYPALVWISFWFCMVRMNQ